MASKMVSKLTDEARDAFRAELRARVVEARRATEGMEDHDLKVQVVRSVMAGLPFAIEECAQEHGTKPRDERDVGGDPEGFSTAHDAPGGDVDMVMCEVELSGLSDTDFEAAQNWIKSEEHPQTGERVFSFDEDEKVWRGTLPRARAGNLDAFIEGLDGGSEVRIQEGW